MRNERSLNGAERNYELETLFVLSHSAFLIFTKSEIEDFEKLRKYSFLLCSLWGIAITQWIKLQEESKQKQLNF